ncbi:MAG: hypothetical protein ABI130_05825 [Leifsonia sp.]
MTGRRMSRWWRVVAAVVVVFLAAVSLIATTQPANAATTTSCGYATAGTGTYARTLCWISMAGYDPAIAKDPAGQEIAVTILGTNGYKLYFTIHQNSNRPPAATSFPTYTTAFLGRNVGGSYTGVPGLPALYQVPGGGDTKLELTDIRVTDIAGNPVAAFSMVGADAETTDTGESLRFTSDKPLRQIAPLGTACPTGFTGVGTTTVVCSSDDAGYRNGLAMLAADNPSQIGIDMLTTQRQGVAFGILLSKIQLNKTVASRMNASDAFDVSVATGSGTVLRTANTRTAASATTGEVSTIGASAGAPFTMSEAATSGSLSDYNESWACTRNGAADPALPAGTAGASADVTLSIGDLVNCTITNTALQGSISLQKNAGPVTDVNRNGLRDAGDTIPYTFLVTNTGAVTVNSIAVSDPSLGAVTCPVNSLAPGVSTICSSVNPHTFTAANVAAGQFTNSATASATPQGSSTPVNSNTSATTTTLEAPKAALTLAKTVTPANAAAPGNTVTYQYTVKNTGNVDISAVSIAETAFSGSGTRPSPVCPVTSLAPETSTVCAADYTVTQADFDAGSVSNTAHATGADPTSGTVNSPDSTARLTATPTPRLTLEKSVSPDDAASFVVGRQLTYSFVITNSGSVTLTGLGVTEQSFTGTGGTVSPVCPASAPVLPLGQVTCTATYTLTQADIDRGEVLNSADAVSTAPDGSVVKSSVSTVVVPGNAAPALTVEKTASPASVSSQGDVVSYQFAVENTGNVTLKSVVVNETAFSGAGPIPAVSCPAGAATMLPGARVVCTASYTLTAADADKAQLTNTAAATGAPPSSAGGDVTSAPSTATVPISENAALELVKTASPLQAAAAGDTITYSFAVRNTGDSTVSGIRIAEGAFSGTGPAPTVTCPAGAAALAPGAIVTCTGSYTVTQADADAGQIENSATANGTALSGIAVASNKSTNVVPIVLSPAVTLQKTASVSNVTAAGQTLTYQFLVKNTGNVTLHSSDVVETRFTGHTVLRPVCPSGISSLAPSDSIVCTADYVVTQADMDAGKIENTARVAGETPTGDPITTPESQIDITAQAAPALTVDKSVSPTSITAAGQPVMYSYLIKNTGNVTLSDVTAVEGAFTGTGPAPVVSCPPAASSLAPDTSVTCTAMYTATQADVDTKYVTNTATAHGTPPAGGTPVDSEPSTTTFGVVSSPNLTIVKSASPSTITRSGQVVTYSFVVANSGNLTMTNVDVIEGTFTGTGIAPVVNCPPGPIQLAPNESVTCTATYTATQDDVDAGTVDNTATVQGSTLTAPDILLEFGPATNTVDAPPQPSLSIVKSGTPSDRASFVAGAKITYTFVVTNTGNVTMDGVQVADSGFTGSGPAPTADCSAEPTTLTPGEQLRCTATYTITQADTDAGGISNTATASGAPPTGGDRIRSTPSTVVLPHDGAPALELVKTAQVSGSTIDYRFAVTNTGNVTVRNVAIDEGAFSGTGPFPAIDCPSGGASMAPGEAIVCTAAYTVTEADRRAGAVTNTATVSGDGPGGAISSPPSTARAALPALVGDNLARTGLRLDQTIWLGAVLMALGAAAIGYRLLRRRRA